MKTKIRINVFGQISLPAILLLAVGGCTHVATINVVPTELQRASGHTKASARAALVLDSELKNFQYEYEMAGDKFVFPLGSSLEQYARSVAQHTFSEVIIHPTPEAAANTADVILIPRPLKADQSMGMWAWDDRNFLLVIEWAARDPKNENVLWLKPIEGKAAHRGGNLFTAKSNQRQLFQKLFDDLSTKTSAALENSPEIRRLVVGAPSQ